MADMSGLPELVQAVKELQRANPEAKTWWVQFVKAKGERNLDPARHAVEFLQEFVITVQSGDTSAFQASIEAAGGGEHDLVGQIKELQRTNPDAKEQWLAFTETLGGGIRDPARHSQESLQLFLATVTSGGSFAAEGALNLADVVKQLRPRSSSFQQAWGLYCRNHGGGMSDPTAHNNTFINSFFQAVTQSYVTSGGEDGGGGGGGPATMMGMGHMGGEPMMKRMRTSVPAMAVSGDPQKEALAQAVNDFQKSSPENKHLWEEYAKAFLGGRFDPRRQESAVLQEFCVNHGVPVGAVGGGGGGGGPAGMGGMGAMAGMGGGMGGGMAGMSGMAAALASLGMGGMGSMGGGMGGSMGGMSGMGAASGNGGGMASDDAKAPFVERVKSHSRASRENAAMWAAFCGRVKDPSRHDEASLQQFCTLHNC